MNGSPGEQLQQLLLGDSKGSVLVGMVGIEGIRVNNVGGHCVNVGEVFVISQVCVSMVVVRRR